MNNHKDNNLKLTDQEIYFNWEKTNSFKAQNDAKKDNFTIMIPPPNVTGNLHVGHALTMTLQDILVRFKRLQGFNVLWQPGTDHAGIATQMMVEKKLQSENLTKHQLGRDAFIQKVWEWKEQSGGAITKQLRRLGASLDWSRERFTLDDKFSKSVTAAFVKLYNDGLIYRSKRLVNWDPKLQSAISDLEVKNKEIKGFMWYIKYPILNSEQFITIATTRPETMLGDVAIIVNPLDERYKNYIGKYAILPLVGKKIPIIADEYTDITKGSGAVKITPGHDFNDFKLAQKYNLPMISILDTNANLKLDDIETESNNFLHIVDKDFILSLNGKNVKLARELVTEKLKSLNLLEKIENHLHHVPYADRSDVVVEPMLTTQWFCNAEELSKSAIEIVKNNQTQFIPKNWENTFFNWMNNIEPWCISRQLWWGHRIPAWYGPDGKIFVNHSEDEAIKEAIDFYKNPNIKLTQDDDVLDTWFSSSLWPFATLGWPEETEDLKNYYPTSVLVTGFDIIFFWVSRMMMMGMYFMKKVPFSKIYIHGLILDEHGQKMSKTKGNVIDPLDIIDNYGADALRWSVCSLAGPGRDLRLSENIILSSRSFITKIKNAANFWQKNNIETRVPATQINHPLCLWLLKKVNEAILNATESLENFRFDYYSEQLYHFVWHIFCDWYIELSKPLLKTEFQDQILTTANIAFETLIKLLHPVIPYITETLWHELDYGKSCSLINNSWPKEINITPNEEEEYVNFIIEIISKIRALKIEAQIPNKTLVDIFIKSDNPKEILIIKKWSNVLSELTKTANIVELAEKKLTKPLQTIVKDSIIIIESLVNNDAEKLKITNQIAELTIQLEKQTLLLNNADFIARAKEEVINNKKEQVKIIQNKIDKLTESMKLL